MSFAAVVALAFDRSRVERFSSRVFVNVLGPLMLCGAVASLWHAKALIREYGAYAPVSRTIERNYQSGWRTQSTQMVYESPPNRGVLAFAEIKPGTYTSASPDAEYPRYILRYFNKQVMVVREPQK